MARSAERLTPATPVTEKDHAYRHGVVLLVCVLLLWALGCTFFWCLMAVNPKEGWSGAREREENSPLPGSSPPRIT